MPEDYSPSKTLAGLSGFAKGVQTFLKQREAAENKENAAAAQMLRTMMPLLFRQQQFEQEQRQNWIIAGLEREQKQEESEARALQWQAEFDQKQVEFEAELEDMRARREESQRNYELARDTLTETERHNAATESLSYLQEANRLLLARLDNITQILVSGTFKDKTDAAESLARLQGEINASTEQAIQRIKDASSAAAREETQAFEREMVTEREEAKVPAAESAEWKQRAQDWRDEVNKFLTQSWQMSEWEKKPQDLGTAETVKRVLEAFEAQRLQIPEQYRPAASELPMMESGVERPWKKDIPPKLIYRRTETPAAAPTSAAAILKKYDISDTGNLIEKTKNLTGDAKATQWQKIYRWLKDNGVPEEEIAIIEKEVGVR